MKTQKNFSWHGLLSGTNSNVRVFEGYDREIAEFNTTSPVECEECYENEEVEE